MLHFYYKYYRTAFSTDIVLTFYGTTTEYTADSYNLHKLLQWEVSNHPAKPAHCIIQCK